MVVNLINQKIYVHAFHKIDYENNSVTDFDWAVFDGLYDILSDFKNATTWFSDGYYPTSPLLFKPIIYFGMY